MREKIEMGTAKYRLTAFIRVEPEKDRSLAYEAALTEIRQQELLCPENLYRIEELPEKGST